MTGAYRLDCQAMTVAPVSVTAPVHVATSIEAASLAPQDPVRARAAHPKPRQQPRSANSGHPRAPGHPPLSGPHASQAPLGAPDCRRWPEVAFGSARGERRGPGGPVRPSCDQCRPLPLSPVGPDVRAGRSPRSAANAWLGVWPAPSTRGSPCGRTQGKLSQCSRAPGWRSNAAARSSGTRRSSNRIQHRPRSVGPSPVHHGLAGRRSNCPDRPPSWRCCDAGLAFEVRRIAGQSPGRCPPGRKSGARAPSRV